MYVFCLYAHICSDTDVGKLLRMLTFIPLPIIDTIMIYHDAYRSQRYAQQILAEHITHLIHGDMGLQSATIQTQMLFQPDTVDFNSMSVDVLLNALNGIPTVDIEMNHFVGVRVADVLTRTGIIKTKGM